MKMKIYLACPYTDEDETVEEKRFEEVTYAAGVLMNKGHIVFSPLTHCHPIRKKFGLPGTWAFWESFDQAFIEWCDLVIVYTIEGWDKSTGVKNEMDICREQGKPLKMFNLKDIQMTLTTE